MINPPRQKMYHSIVDFMVCLSLKLGSFFIPGLKKKYTCNISGICKTSSRIEKEI